MSGLLWWSGITGQTPIRDIGWTWVLLSAAVVLIVTCVIWLARHW